MATVPPLGSERAWQSGRALVAITSIVQGVGIGLGIADVASGGDEGLPRVPYGLATIPFAPLSVIGYERLLSDGSRASALQGAGVGFLVGAAYSGLEAVLAAGAMRRQTMMIDGEIYAIEDTGAIFDTLVLVPHVGVAIGMLIPGVILSAAGAAKRSRVARHPAPVLAPAIVPGGGGLQLAGRFR